MDNIVITVSREAGSGGKLVAQKIAQSLGIDFYNEELMDLLAKKTRRRKEIIKKLDEKERSLLDDFVNKLIDPEYLSEESFIKNLCLVIGALSREKSCVILGRGANFILPDDACLRIRIIAPYLTRVFYTQKYEKRTKPDAEKRVKKHDLDRKEFIKQYFGKNPSNANYYDLVFNTQNTGLDSIVKTIVKTVKARQGKE